MSRAAENTNTTPNESEIEKRLVALSAEDVRFIGSGVLKKRWDATPSQPATGDSMSDDATRPVWFDAHDAEMIREALKLFATHYSLDRGLAAWIGGLSERLHAARPDTTRNDAACRCVFVSEEMRDWAEELIGAFEDDQRARQAALLYEFVAAWDAAPADPAEALGRTLYRWRWPDDPDLTQYGPSSMANATDAVLAALGLSRPNQHGQETP